MSRRAWLALAIALGLVAYTYGEDKPVENKQLANLKAAYAAQVKAAVQPLQEKYAKHLDELMRAQGAAGQLEMAQQVKAELDAISAEMAADKVRTRVSTAVNKLQIVSAKYGQGSKWVDATAYVKDCIATTTNVVIWDNGAIDKQCGDPTGHPGKTVVIVYKLNGQQKTRTMELKDVVLD